MTLLLNMKINKLNDVWWNDITYNVCMTSADSDDVGLMSGLLWCGSPLTGQHSESGLYSGVSSVHTQVPIYTYWTGTVCIQLLTDWRTDLFTGKTPGEGCQLSGQAIQNNHKEIMFFFSVAAMKLLVFLVFTVFTGKKNFEVCRMSSCESFKMEKVVHPSTLDY